MFTCFPWPGAALSRCCDMWPCYSIYSPLCSVPDTTVTQEYTELPSITYTRARKLSAARRQYRAPLSLQLLEHSCERCVSVLSFQDCEFIISTVPYISHQIIPSNPSILATMTILSFGASECQIIMSRLSSIGWPRGVRVFTIYWSRPTVSSAQASGWWLVSGAGGAINQTLHTKLRSTHLCCRKCHGRPSLNCPNGRGIVQHCCRRDVSFYQMAEAEAFLGAEISNEEVSRLFEML